MNVFYQAFVDVVGWTLSQDAKLRAIERLIIPASKVAFLGYGQVLD